MLRLDYEALADAASKLSTEGENFENTINNLKGIIEALPDSWEADTCDKYVANYQEYDPKLREVVTFIDDLSAQLKKISDNFAQADSDMASQM